MQLPFHDRHALLVVGGLGTSNAYFEPFRQQLPACVDFFFYDFVPHKGREQGGAGQGTSDPKADVLQLAKTLMALYELRRITVMCFSISCYAVAAALRHMPIRLVLVDPPTTTYETNSGIRLLLGAPAWVETAWSWAPRTVRCLSLQALSMCQGQDTDTVGRTPWCVDWKLACHSVQELRRAVVHHLLPYRNLLAANRRGLTPLVLVADRSQYYAARGNHASQNHLLTRDVPGTHHVLHEAPQRIIVELRRYASWPPLQTQTQPQPSTSLVLPLPLASSLASEPLACDEEHLHVLETQMRTPHVCVEVR